MANQDQIQRLRQGVESWNAWRQKNPKIKIDLKGANLRGLNLKYANLREADLSQADIRSTNLSEADLTAANCRSVQGGLQKRWLISLVLKSVVLAGVSGFLCGFLSYPVILIFSDDITFRAAGWISALMILLFWVTTVRQGLTRNLRSMATVAAVAGSVIIAMAGALAAPVIMVMVLAVVVTIALGIVIAAAGSVAGTIAMTLAGAVAAVGSLILTGIAQ